MNGKTILFGGLLGVSATQGLCAAAAAQGEDVGARRPNVVIFLTDDQGAIDLNCFGAEDLHTPHIDALAERGVRFTRFYANSSISSPSRAALLTGCYPQRAGVPLIVRPDSTDPGLPPGATTLADVLKEHGYATAAIGKWHLGYRAEAHPNAHGFDYFLDIWADASITILIFLLAGPQSTRSLLQPGGGVVFGREFFRSDGP